MIGGNQLAEQGTIKSILFARAATTRTWCLEHASRKFSWTTSEFHGTCGGVPARQGIEQKNVHDMESST